jgi:hypothetical protein
MMAITTRSSIKVKPLRFMIDLLNRPYRNDAGKWDVHMPLPADRSRAAHASEKGTRCRRDAEERVGEV